MLTFPFISKESNSNGLTLEFNEGWKEKKKKRKKVSLINFFFFFLWFARYKKEIVEINWFQSEEDFFQMFLSTQLD